jgi:hypothetical protein
MTIHSWKTNFIGLNKPSKVLSGTADSFTSIGLWPYANGEDDPYWSGGINPQYYRWQVTFTVNERLHGSHLTRTPFRFNAQDVEVGDFVAGAQDGKVCQIMSIISKTDSQIVAIVEDRLRYNTFRDPTGFGLFTTPGQVIFFQINELGYPMLDPVPGEASSDFADNVLSRFQYLNPLINYVLEKQNHGFQQGDAICIEDEEFVLSDRDNVDKFVGTVVHPGPGPHQFILRPANGIIDFVPSLPGNVGDYIYPSIDGSGDLTIDDSSRRPIYMKVATELPSISTGTGIDPLGVDDEVIEFNRKQMTLTGSGNGYVTLDEVIDIINAETYFHKITALKVGAATQVISGQDGLLNSYGVVAGYTPFSASINGTLVNFTTTVSGAAAYGDPIVADANDMVIDINNANITDITATVLNGGALCITNSSGGTITIANISADANGNDFAGAGSISALPIQTLANTSSYALRLQRNDGGPLTMRDVQGTYLDRAGVMSGQTGRYALGLNIEQGLRSSRVSVVADLTARDALYPLVGDQAHVLNAGHGEWAIYVFDGANWQEFGNKRSKETDARTLVLDVDVSVLSVGINTLSIGTISSDRTVKDVRVLVTAECPSDCSLTVGTTMNKNAFTDIRDAVLTASGSYIVDCDYRITSYTEVVAEVTTQSLGTGQVTIILTYV